MTNSRKPQYRTHGNILNILVAFTNITAIISIITSYKAHDYTTMILIICASFASFVSHLFESHKHGMVGFGCSQQYSYVLNRIDVVMAVLLVVRVLYCIITCKPINILDAKLTFITLTAVFFVLVSEVDKSPSTQVLFVITHSVWHLLIFLALDVALIRIYQTR